VEERNEKAENPQKRWNSAVYTGIITKKETPVSVFA